MPGKIKYNFKGVALSTYILQKMLRGINTIIKYNKMCFRLPSLRVRCFQIIVSSHSKLRCPECRVLVEIKIDELPPNVLLMRILEGIQKVH